MSNVQIIHGDCMEAMKAMPDKAFDLAIVDPPYGKNYIKRKNHVKIKSQEFIKDMKNYCKRDCCSATNLEEQKNCPYYLRSSFWEHENCMNLLLNSKKCQSKMAKGTQKWKPCSLKIYFAAEIASGMGTIFVRLSKIIKNSPIHVVIVCIGVLMDLQMRSATWVMYEGFVGFQSSVNVAQGVPDDSPQ